MFERDYASFCCWQFVSVLMSGCETKELIQAWFHSNLESVPFCLFKA
ncbi:hypothetical protein AALB_3270 [Agarivorans albus MKT 106]|uniref:Uncharacterized protein n=1 Tax=Agarivorans albus MKT 106 TaxID=1331007 RepID=R9PPF4_AGAAL|nr:hypothetical protein AALB_3270 [Agarivorans albus MKT 106]